MKMKETIKTIVFAVLIVAITLFLLKKNTNLYSKISYLNWEKEQLENQIKSLQAERIKIMDSISKVKVDIVRMEAKDSTLTAQNQKLGAQLKQIKSKYEKANNHSVNYNTDSIRRYFTEFN